MKSTASRFPPTRQDSVPGPGQYPRNDGAFTDVLKSKQTPSKYNTPATARRQSLTDVQTTADYLQQPPELKTRRASCITHTPALKRQQSLDKLHSHHKPQTQSKSLHHSISDANILKSITNAAPKHSQFVQPAKPLITPRRTSMHAQQAVTERPYTAHTPLTTRRASMHNPAQPQQQQTPVLKIEGRGSYRDALAAGFSNKKPARHAVTSAAKASAQSLQQVDKPPRRCSKRLSAKRSRDSLSVDEPSSKRHSTSPRHSVNIPSFDLAVAHHRNSSDDTDEFVAMSPELLAESLESAKQAVHSGLLQPADAVHDIPPLSLNQHTVSPVPATSRVAVPEEDNSMTAQIRAAIERCFTDAGITAENIKSDNAPDVLHKLHSAGLSLMQCATSNRLGNIDEFVWQFKCLGQLELYHNVASHHLTVHKLNTRTQERVCYVDSYRFKDAVDTLGIRLYALNRSLCDTKSKAALDKYLKR